MNQNASESSIVPNEMLVEFLPEELTLNPKFDIRGDAGDDAQTAQADLELMESIKQHGQQQPCKVRRIEGGTEVVFGHRRYNAILRINMESAGEEGYVPMKVKCILTDMTDEQALQAAWDENAKRKNMNPISEARLIGTFRQEFGWKGSKGTAKVAKFMGKSPAWVSEREKLLALDESMQTRVQAGELSAEAALMLPGVKPEKREQVIADAKASHEAEKKDEADKQTTGKDKKKAKGGKSGKPAPVPARHVAAAIRNTPEVLVDPNKTKALKAKDLVAFFASYVGGIPFLYEPVQDFLTYFVEKYSKGKGSDRTMESKFEAMIAPACKGQKMDPPVEVVKPVKPSNPKPTKAEKTERAVAAMKAEAAKKKAGRTKPKAPKAPKSKK